MTRPICTPALVAAINRDVPRRAAVVWWFLWASADRETSLAWPSTTTLAEALGMHREDVSRATRLLQEKGWLRKEARGGKSSIYTVLEPSPGRCPQNATSPEQVDPVPPHHLTPTRHTPCPRGATQNTEGTQKEHKEGSLERTKPFDPTTVELPFQSDGFRSSWLDFCEHRQDVKHPLSELAATRILAKCKRWGEAVAIEALDNSIESGWKGIFKPRADRNGQPDEPEPLEVFE